MLDNQSTSRYNVLMPTFQTFSTIIVPALATVLYVVCSVGHAVGKNYPMAIMWGGYVIANIGVIAAQYLTGKH